MDFNPTRMCELLVGLPEVIVTAVEDRPGGLIVVHIEARLEQTVHRVRHTSRGEGTTGRGAGRSAVFRGSTVRGAC